MATTERLKPEYLDLRLPGNAVALLRRWGARLGMSPEGMARMLLLMRVHEMLGEEAADDDAMVADTVDEGERSTALWTARLQSIGLTSDELPAPHAVNGDTRIYHADAFTWPEGATPTMPFAHVMPDGRIGVSRRAE